MVVYGAAAVCAGSWWGSFEVLEILVGIARTQAWHRTVNILGQVQREEQKTVHEFDQDEAIYTNQHTG